MFALGMMAELAEAVLECMTAEYNSATAATTHPLTFFRFLFLALAEADARRVDAASIAPARSLLTPSRLAIPLATLENPGWALLIFVTPLRIGFRKSRYFNAT